MSHAACLVICDSYPSQAELTKLLQPWHEFECTGTDDQYVQEIDKTAEYREKYATDKSRMIRMADGSLKDAYDDCFYREPTAEEREKIGPMFFGSGFGHGISYTSKDWGDGKGYQPRVRCVPEGCNEVEVLAGELEPFSKWVAGYTGYHAVKHGRSPDKRKTHKYGWTQLDPDSAVVRVTQRTNPNKRWDWWVVGGRCSGKLLNKAGEVLDVCSRADIDLDAMKAMQIRKRREWAEECCNKAEGMMEDLDIACRVAHLIETTWQALPEPRPRGGEYHKWVADHGGDWAIYAKFRQANWLIPEPSPNQSLSDWIEAAPALSSWAVVLDNQWFEKGKMGWWATSSDDKANWDDHFNDLFGLIRDDQYLAVVDYHI